MTDGYHSKHLFFAFLGGAATGAAVALLNAPASGAETRARLRATGNKEMERARHLPEALKAATRAAEEAFKAALGSEEEVETRPPGNGKSGKARHLAAAAAK